LVYENAAGERIVVAGYHRVHAAMRLGRSTIWAVVEERSSLHDATLYLDIR
jgi:ParB-like chromosome segregation protein Spo0J